LAFPLHPSPNSNSRRVARLAFQKEGRDKAKVVLFTPGFGIGLGNRSVGRVGSFQLADGVGEVNRGAIWEAEAVMKAFQGRPAGIDPFQEFDIPLPVLNNVKVFLKARGPGNSTGAKRSELGFNREPNSIKSRMEGVVGRLKRGEKRRAVWVRGLEEGLGLGLKGDKHGINLGDPNGREDTLGVEGTGARVIAFELTSSSRGN
jgi:hypothetical protein